MPGSIAPLELEVQRLRALAERPAEHGSEVAANLRQLYHLIHDIDIDAHDPVAVRRAAPNLMRELFLVQMSLRDRIGDWQARGLMTRDAEYALRDVFRILRYAGDMLGEHAIRHDRLADPTKTRRGFTGTDYNTQVHPAFDTGQNIPFRGGDVVLMRGSAHNSAAIARIGDNDSQFSHIAIVHQDERGKFWIVEALIEDGAVVNSLDRVLEHGLGRAVVYRHPDADLARRAGEIAYRRVRATTDGSARHIPYDFTMRLNGRRSLFCAKLVQQAFLDASDKKLVLPAFKTRFDQRNASFFKSVGVTARETFAPGDIDIDPRFQLVAEWRDYRVTSALRRQDMIMTKFFEWMETRGWKFQQDLAIRLISVFGRLSSRLSDRARELIASTIPKVPRNMSRSCVGAIVMIHKSAEQLVPAMRALEDNHIKRTGLPIHPRALLEHLERLRQVSGGRVGYLVGKV